MRIICWNCRGVGNPQAVNAMVDIIQYYKPSILFLMETKANGVRMEQIKSLLRFSHCFFVDCVGIGGALSLMWKDDVKLAITGYCSNFIDSTIGDGSDCWRFTGFYGCPDPESGRRRTSWNLLRALADRSQLPWLCSGDYNDIADPLEKVGGPLHCISLINGFRNALADANLNDIQSVGSFLSYTYREGTVQCSKERLDRACSNATWDAHFPDAISSNLVAYPGITASVSNHTPLLIETVGTQDAFLQYFSGLFSNSPTDFAELLPLVQPRIGAEDNVELLADFTDEEFHSALFQMDPNKAPGLDGLNLAFFQKYWPIIGVDVCNIYRLWLAQGNIPSEISSALIVLILKCVNPVDVKDFRPIALCNVIYKILSKALANRLKRTNYDNFIVAFETMHGLKLQNRGSVGSCALKIDIAKAYDRVEWSYLFAMLSALGFSDTWVGWMHMCFSNMSYYIAVNGAEIGPVVPSRGLSLLIQDSENRGLLHGCCAKVGCPPVSHIFFTDDSLLFFDGTVGEAIRIKQILGVYKKASGQAVNFDKSGIMFSPCVSEENRLTISGILDVHLPLGSGNYLGDRIWKRISSWSNRFLSRAGREVLIKFVLQAIPTYCMNVFLLPVFTCRQLHVMMNKFWWGGCREDGRGMNWLSWDRMCGRKSEGGMGFWDLASFNTALLGKQGWRLLVDTNSLLYRVLKAKYFPNGNFLSARLGSNYSFVWKSILSSQQVLQRGVFVVNCHWIPRDIGFMPLDESIFVPEAMRVCDLFVEGELHWDVEKLMNIFSVVDMRAILTIPLPLFPKPDKLIWHLHKKGVYSVKSAYFCALELSGRTGLLGYNDGWNRLWSLDRACRGVLPTRDILLRRLWRLVGFSTAVDFPIFMDFFIHIYNTFSRERTARMAIHAWKLWHARNERLWVNKVLSPSEVHHAASSYFNDYVASLVARPRTLSHPSVPRVLLLVEATTLEVDWIAFIDCAVFASADLFGFAAVFEDLEGFFFIAISGFYEGGGQPAGCIFTDNQSLTLAIRSPLDDFSEFGLVVSDCKDAMRSHGNIHVRWIRRSENRAAHLLARESIHHGRFKIWINIPDCLLDYYSTR
ncbi:hypothetical protein MANES_05G055002v8 [Manihot esculenta]|uniref:Uncharacterized protein n=1 Tax=Manihot esculenta TaxID=3983 RepID=A0ACB7HP44_MANES|nr:hypothetical protein MANES_05G055002v8 [Manihot esculenta]